MGEREAGSGGIAAHRLLNGIPRWAECGRTENQGRWEWVSFGLLFRSRHFLKQYGTRAKPFDAGLVKL